MGALRLFHFDIPTWGNFGDKVLFPVVRDAFRVLGGADSALLGGADSARAEPKFTFTSAAALRREVDEAAVERINATADAVVIESSANQPSVRLRLEGLDADGRWLQLAGAPETSDAPRPLGLRRAVAEELKRRGNDYLLIFDDNVGADDLRLNADLWGIQLVAAERTARLYRLP